MTSRSSAPRAGLSAFRRYAGAWRGIVGAFLLTIPRAHAAEPLATIELRESLGRDWPTTMVTYCVTGEKDERGRMKDEEGKDAPGLHPSSLILHPFPSSPAWVRIKESIKPDAMRLIDAGGQDVPLQLWRAETDGRGNLVGARLSFMAGLAKHSNAVYRLMTGAPALVAPTGVNLSSNVAALVLDNGVTAVRLPPAGTFTFEKPLSFGAAHQDMVKLYGRQAAAGIAPGPIQGVRLSDGRWVGGSYFQAADSNLAPRVLGYSCRVTERGPVFTEAQIRYQFDGDRQYRMTVRLLPGDPAIRIDEQFDMKRIGETRDWRGYSSNDWQVVMSLSAGWQPGGWKPDTAFWERYSYGNSLQSEKVAEEAALKELGFDFSSADYGTHRVAYSEPSRLIFGVEPWCPWGRFTAHFGLVEAKALPAPTGNTNLPPDPAKLKGIPFLGVMPMHAGSWRADGPYNYKQLVSHAGDDVALHWPLDAMRHPNANVHTGEYDPDMPFTTGRRLWALIAGPLQTVKTLHAFRSYEGYINLDTAKDWILDWVRDPAVTYPRMFFSKEDVARMASALDKHPAGRLLKTYLYFEDSEARRHALWQQLSLYGPFAIHNQTEHGLNYYFSLWRQAHSAEEWLVLIEELLSSPGLEPGQRRILEQRLAAFCYLVSEPDFNPRGSMTHLGNPNMAIIRFLALPFAAALIPDHPRAADWMKVSQDYVAYKLAMNVAPGGGWSELFTYYDASAPALIHGANILGRMSTLPRPLVDVATEAGMFPFHFLSPKDPRFGVRLISHWGHEGKGGFGQWLPTAGLTRKSNPDVAKAMVWGWDQCGRLAGFHDGNFNGRCVAVADLFNELPAGYVPPALGSVWQPGVGAVLRAHAGDPDETFLSYRQGYLISHCDDNQGDFVLHAKGAPLVDLSLFAYGLHQHEPYIAMNRDFGWTSAPRFDAQTNSTDVRQGSNAGEKAGSWNPSSEIHVHSFGASADYLRGRSDNEGRRWTRQILFLKGKRAAGPNYFIFRDSADALPGVTNAPGPMWWNVRFPGAKAQVTTGGQGAVFTSLFGSKLDVRVLQPAEVKAEVRDVSRDGSVVNHVDTWRKDGEPVLKPDQSAWVKTNETFAVTAFGSADSTAGMVVALYPQGRDEAAPGYASLTDGVARITTSEGTDTVFVDRRPMQFRQDDIEFTGQCGAVRVYPDEVHLVIAEGPGEIRYRGVTLRSPQPATRIIKMADTAKARVIEEPGDKVTIRFDPPRGDRQELASGVIRIATKRGFAVSVDSAEPVSIATNGVLFTGRRGGIDIDEAAGTARLVMLDGEMVGYRESLAWGAAGPYEVTYYADRIEGRSEGQGRFLCVTQPAGVDRLASLIIDGRAYAPGTANTVDPAIAMRAQGPESKQALGGTLVVPLMPGSHAFAVKNLPQPPVWKNWQQW